MVSACLASLQKFLKGKSEAYEYVAHLHSAARPLSSPSHTIHGVFNCQIQILTKICFVDTGSENNLLKNKQQ